MRDIEVELECDSEETDLNSGFRFFFVSLESAVVYNVLMNSARCTIENSERREFLRR